MHVTKINSDSSSVFYPNSRSANISASQSPTKAKINFNYISSHTPVARQIDNRSQSNSSDIVNNFKNISSFVLQSNVPSNLMPAQIKTAIVHPTIPYQPYRGGINYREPMQFVRR